MNIRTAPATNPGVMRGNVMLVNDLNLEAPRLVAASSRDLWTCLSTACDDLTVYGNLRIE